MLAVPRNRTRSRRILAATGALGALTGAGLFSLAYFFVEMLTRPEPDEPSQNFTFTPWELDLPFTEVTFPDASGAHMLRGWWIDHVGADGGAAPRSVIIASSGYRRNKSDMLGIGKWLYRAGHTLLLVDFYGHGVGYGAPVTLGFHEVDDLLGAVDYAAARAGQAPIGAIGFSMGAAVTIMAAARDQRIRAVVADSPFATHRAIAYDAVHTAVPLAAAPLIHLLDPMLGWRAGYHFAQVEPLREVAHIAPRPLLLIHGTADQTVPPYHSAQLYAAAEEPKTFWQIPGAAHCGGYFVDRLEYCRRVADFFATALLSTTPATVRQTHALD